MTNLVVKKKKKNLSQCKKEKDVLKNSNIASHKWVMLEGKVPGKNVKNSSKRNFSAAEMSLVSKYLKFVCAYKIW